MFKDLNGKKIVIGCIHLHPMPNTPFYTEGDYQRSIEKALRDAQSLLDGGADGCLIQPVDKVYPATDDTDYVRVACMSVIGNEVRRLAGPDFKLGVQIMWNCITPSLAAAKACGADFTRCTALVGSTDSPFGRVEANPLKVQNYRKAIGAMDVAMIAEVAGYHFLNDGGYDKAKMLANVKNALTVGADAIEVFHNDEELNNRMVTDIKEAFDVPVVLGGGTDGDNCDRRLNIADCAIVGSYFEKRNWGGPVYADAVRTYVDKVRVLEK